MHELVNPQQRKFYLITGAVKISRIASSAVVLLIILGAVLGD
jgi:hypothetical protein